MNHDITHCNGEGCPCRETCRRYHAHLDLTAPARINEPHRGCPSYIDPKNCIDNRLSMYWKETNVDNGYEITKNSI